MFTRLIGLLMAACGLVATQAAERPKTGQPWADMDYGPFLTASIEAQGPGTNIAMKGVAIRVGDWAPGGTGEAVVFDTDLLRYAAGWSGSFVALKGVVFDGEHWAYPRIDGIQSFGNQQTPGWGKAGSFKDPRSYPYGPLPRDWAHWRGLYLHGRNVVLSYTVGRSDVLELPGGERRGPLKVFTRTLDISGTDAETELELQVAQEPGQTFTLRSLSTPSRETQDAPANAVLAVLVPDATRADEGRRWLAEPAVVRWNLDEPSGAAAAGQGPAAAPMVLHGAFWSAGREGGALQFDGRGYAEAVPREPLDLGAAAFTVTAWIQTRQDGVIFAETEPEGPWVPNAKALFIRQGRLTFDVGWVGFVEAPTRVDSGRWVHVGLGWDPASGEASLFVDGQREARGTLKPAAPLAHRVLRLGFGASNFPKDTRFTGLIDDVRIHRGLAPEAAVQSLAQRREGATVLVAGLVGAPNTARWNGSSAGDLRLKLPVGREAIRLKLLLSRTEPAQLPAFASLVRGTARPEPLAPLTRGGPARWSGALPLRGQRGPDIGPLAIDTLSWPAENPWSSWMRFGGFDFFKDGQRAAISTWSGDVWTVEGLSESLDRLNWRRFATGLYQPLGLRIVDDVIYVLGRDQITRLRDLNGDGEADAYENFNNDTMNTEHFHEFALDLQTDGAGDFYYMKAARHARDALHPHHGTLVKVSRDGERTEVLAGGFRAPNGLGLGPDGTAYTTDQEGYWMPANRLNRIQPKGFHGNAWAWWSGPKPTRFEPPICWIHPKVDRSPSTMIWVPAERWGPLADHLLSLSYGVGRIFLVPTETVEGVVQGGVTPLPLEFDTGIMRARFHPGDGHLYVCGLYGWAGNKTQPGGFHRVRYTGRPLQMPVELHALTNGVVLGFAEPLDPASAADVGNYGVEAWNYRWSENYGSPDYRRDGEKGRDRLEVRAVRVAEDRRRVFLEVPAITPVMQMHVQLNVRTAAGGSVQTFVHHTVHALANDPPERWVGGGSAPVTAAATFVTLRREAPGLVQVLKPRGPSGAGSDARVSRLVQVQVPDQEPVSPFLTAGPFQAKFEGFIRADVSDTVRFHARGTGSLSVRVNDIDAVPFAVLGPEGPAGPPVRLRGGLNPIKVDYESPSAGAAQLRLFWSGDGFAAEPVPPGVLVHEADRPDLQASQLKRQARALFAERHCVSCHAPEVNWTNAMPELGALAASLEGAGDRFRAQWVAAWALDPGGLIPGALMPRCLGGPAESAKVDARDVAAFLSTLTATNPPSALAVPRGELAATGADLFDKIGCTACHLRLGETRLENDDRRSLGHVKAKWQPGALREFLEKPTRHQSWTRMPDFQLKPEEAEALAAHLLERAEQPSSLEESPGDPARGRELALQRGCAQCHTIPGLERQRQGPHLESLAGRRWTSGCLADHAAERRTAPEFGFAPAQLESLRALIESDLASLRRDPPAEFARRQFVSARCNACHSREDNRDFWSRLEALEAAAKPKVTNPYDDQDPAQEQTIHRQRPPLTWTGEKLRVEWLEQVLAGGLLYKPRPKLEARMPAFPAQARALARGLVFDHGLEAVSEPRAASDKGLAEVGAQLVRKGALACVDCHAVGAQPALAGADTVTINFAYIRERLRREYYDRYVLDPLRFLPGTMMPRFVNDHGQTGLTNHFGGDGRKQFEAIWEYLGTVNREP